MTNVTGVQRVVREVNAAMTDELSQRGIEVVPLHTLHVPRQNNFRANPYLAADPVMDQIPLSPEEVDAFVLLDLHTSVNFSRLFHAKRQRARPVISFVHDVLPLLRPEWWHGDPERVFRIYMQQLVAMSDHIVVSTQKAHDDLVSLGWRIPGKLHLIPLGSSFRQREPEPAPDDRISILYVSTVEPRKGHDILIGAFDLLRQNGYDIDLTIVGSHGWKCDQIARALETHADFGGRLRWLHSADDLTVSSVARTCSIGVFPSEDEGFGLFLEEGLAYGLKMVVSDIPVFRERLQPNVFYSARTPKAFADALVHAHQTAWVSGARVRTMLDCGFEFAKLVESAL